MYYSKMWKEEGEGKGWGFDTEDTETHPGTKSR